MIAGRLVGTRASRSAAPLWIRSAAAAISDPPAGRAFDLAMSLIGRQGPCEAARTLATRDSVDVRNHCGSQLHLKMDQSA